MRLLPFGLAVAALAAAPAGAATVTFTPGFYYADPSSYPPPCEKNPECGPPANVNAHMAMSDATGADDDVLVEFTGAPGYGFPGGVTLHDSAGLTLQGSPSTCSQVDATTVHCDSNHPQ